ncbi:MAG: hypothetical protein J6W96_05975 [Alphaproteobacteria bacterium]|nr:hypothetical protein [Alphaproteobacteria bacterium]
MDKFLNARTVPEFARQLHVSEKNIEDLYYIANTWFWITTKRSLQEPKTFEAHLIFDDTGYKATQIHTFCKDGCSMFNTRKGAEDFAYQNINNVVFSEDAPLIPANLPRNILLLFDKDFGKY